MSLAFAILAIGLGGAGALGRVQDARERGEIGPSEAARQQLYSIFDRSRMDPRWRFEGEPPARCGTVVLAAIGARLDELDESTRALYRSFVTPAQVDAPPSVYNTIHFRIEYETSGPDAPPATDVAPANGIPDFVERTGEACERSWAIEVDSLGYRAPALSNPGPRYTVRYQNQSSYGFTVVVSGQTTEIVLHPNYIDFPFNDDPDGDAIGSLRITVAHELKHAIQRMYSSWVEDNWLELDATWVEDLVYDQVNDYVQLVRGPQSPFTAPQVPLNAGGSGSYEDCNWQHYQSQKYGNAFLRRFWDRRAVNIEPVINTYTATFAEEGVSFEDAWGEYVTWNFASGARAAVGYGYEEAPLYPTPPVGTFHTTLPVPTTQWGVSPLAVGTHLIDNSDGALSGTPELSFSGSSQIAWRVSVLFQRRSGEVIRIPVPLVGGAATQALTGYDWADARWVALLVGNPYEGGPAFSYTFSARSLAPVQIVHERLADQASEQPYSIVARVVAGAGEPPIGGVTLSYRSGGGATTSLPMAPTGLPDEYRAQIPGQPFGEVIEYAIDGQNAAASARAPAIAGAFYSFQVANVYEPFESAATWTVGDAGDGATGGIWVRAQPNGTVAAPYADATTPPGSLCFVTGNAAPAAGAGEADVDGGRTTLLSPVFTFGTHAYDQIVARYRRWYSNDIGSRPDDVWRVDASKDGGASWVNVETISLGTNDWVPVTVDLQALFGGSLDQVRFRFVAADTGRASLVEAGVDDFEIVAVLHDPVGVGGEPAAIRLGAPWPNPARESAALAFELARASTVRATVRDVLGRTVRRLLPPRELPAGGHTLAWDGMDERGAPAAAGLYFFAVEAGGRRLEARVVQLR